MIVAALHNFLGRGSSGRDRPRHHYRQFAGRPFLEALGVGDERDPAIRIGRPQDWNLRPAKLAAATRACAEQPFRL
jgi:hypothetical protein